MSTRFVAHLTRAVAITLVAAAPLAAQASRSVKSGRCPEVDTKARWYVKQGAWLRESSQTWSNDSLRTALVHAAGLDDPNRGTGALMGYEIVGAAPNVANVARGDAAAHCRHLRLCADGGRFCR